ncbi:Beta-glucuronidase [Cytospora mali]|uniref:Beta-glucuronidase n=1 Tax=Cytospora mali TaxID=578113 RepID=A0A194URQ0_CYTMA|nr:Beta-glucuronidase [Valsa mali var. pyri (nom. inval.)]
MKSSPSYLLLFNAAAFVSGSPSRCSKRHGLTGTNDSSTSLSIVLPTSNDGDVIDIDFPGFGFEEASFVDYVLDSDGNTNEFSLNLINSITNRTGGKPIIRLGGTSADYGKYISNQTVPALPLADDNEDDAVGGTSIGPSFWALASRFPTAQYMVQVPLATTDINETITWVQTALDIIGEDQIYSFELGNEPDWYSNTYDNDQLIPPQWQGTLTNETFVGNYTEYVEAIVETVPGLPNDGKIFQAFDTAAHVAQYSAILCYSLDVGTCFDLGIDNGGYITTVAHHYYQNAGGDAVYLAAGLMDMAWTHWRMDFFECQLSWLKANRPDLPFVLSEVGNSLMDTHMPEYQARLGSALWQVDFYLYAMQLGIARINYQQMLADTYQPIMWLPVEYLGESPHVTANYYSQPLIADFIGSSGTTTMTQLNITSTEEVANVSAYAAFEDGSPKRIAVVNLNYWNQTSSGTDRPSVSIDLSIPSSLGVTTVTVDYLSSPVGAGADADTVTYAGSQWTYDSLGIEVTGVRDDTETISVVNNIATITVNSSSAALISLS